MKLEKSISNLSKRIERFDPPNDSSNYWKGKGIIPLEEWKKLKGTPYELKYFPDDFHNFWTSKQESELKGFSLSSSTLFISEKYDICK